MNVIHPNNPELLAARDAMLLETMRPDSSPWPIAAEYPIALDHGDTTSSFCVITNGELAAHANFWTRSLVDASGRDVGRCALIGNVATTPRFRGQGATRPLFGRFERLVSERSLDLTILWAEPDLHPFYQKSGFRSFGREWRYTFLRNDFMEVSTDPARQILPIPRPPEGHSTDLLCHLMGLRPRVPTLGRSSDEFDRLLKIPDTNLYVRGTSGAPTGYAIIGRGCDMRDTIHEWGATSPDTLFDLLSGILRARQLDACVLLAPGILDGDWRRELCRRAYRSETHEMAMAKGAPDALDRWRDLFIWGMDSI